MTADKAQESAKRSRASLLLLRICAAPDTELRAAFAELAHDEWCDLVDLAISKRVGLLLDRALAQSGQQQLMPEECRAAIEDERRKVTMSTFGHMIALTEAVSFLQAQGIDPIALKGVRLAFNEYPEARLRSLRDLDLLVPAALAEQAQRAMIASGHYEVAPWSDYYGIEFGHQLPELVDRRHGISIEIHHRLNARDWKDEPKLVSMVARDAVHIEIGGAQVRVPSMHANFLHLVEHATLHHMFENGPITLADLHFAARDGQIDWPLLIAQAESMGLRRALLLVCALAGRYGATWVPASLRDTPDDVLANLDVCTAALLRDERLTEHAAMLRGLALRKGQSPGWRVALRAAITPTRLKLASIMRVSGDNPLRWLAYPVWLVQRGRAYLAARHAVKDGDASLREAATLRWLRNI